MVVSNLDYSKSVESEDDLPANILRIENAEDVYETKNYKVRDLYFTGAEGFVNWTLSITNLRPGAQTKGHSHSSHVELCRIVTGEAFIVLDSVAHRVKSGSYILIGKTVHHKVINTSVTEECVFTSDFPDHLIREGFVRKKR